jgi:hypothetical protein
MADGNNIDVKHNASFTHIYYSLTILTRCYHYSRPPLCANRTLEVVAVAVAVMVTVALVVEEAVAAVV